MYVFVIQINDLPKNLGYSLLFCFVFFNEVFKKILFVFYFVLVFKKILFYFFFIYFQREKGGRKRGRETSMCQRNIDQLSLIHPQPGTWPTTQACALRIKLVTF